MPVAGISPQDAQAKTKREKARAKKAAAIEARKKFVATSDEDVLNQILGNAKAGDPTAGSTVTMGQTQAGPTSPLTNKPLGQPGITVGGVASGYTASDWTADFQGNMAGGVPPRITSEVDPKTGKYYIVERDANGVPSQVAIIGDPKNPGAYKKTDRSTAVQEIINDYKTKPDGIVELKRLLINRNVVSGTAAKKLLTSGNNIDSTLASSILKYVDELTATNFNNAAQRNFISFGGDLAGGVSYAGTKTSTSTTFTPKDIAKSDITSFVNDYLGRGATASEVRQYQDILEDFERAHPSKATVTTDAMGVERRRVQVPGATEQDKTALKVAIVYDALSKKGVDPSSISANGGLIGQTMSAIKKFASAYGIQMDDRGALDRVVGTLRAGGTIDTAAINKEEERIKAIAKTKYKNLASAIDQGATPKDIADQFQYSKNKLLETNNPTDMFDPDIQKALHNDGKAGVMSDSDWMFLMKNKQEWRYTQNAREEAAKWVSTIKEKWGLE